ncbi:MAG TPA: hypothetical protein VH988_27040 [Thermoanaerobaculia bacterium]|jgi:hypothetical protein|nr:hypothetical protein [Thermoanaerobaculia bacterium]
MKTWLRGIRWEVQPGRDVNRFPISSDKFDENELILPFHLTAEGFPTIWGPAHAFNIRLNHSLLRLEDSDAAYREQCRQAALDLLTLVVGQFLGLLKPDEIPLPAEGEGGSAGGSRLLRLLGNNLEAEARPMPALVVLRDARLAGAPIAAVNYPDCLWFPVHSYSLGLVRPRIEQALGQIDLEGLKPAEHLKEEETVALVSQLRAYLRQFIEGDQDGLAYGRVLARFEHGLRNLAHSGVAPIRSGRAFRLSGKRVQEIELRRSGDVSMSAEEGCPRCGHDWMNHRYAEGPRVLQGGQVPQRKVVCPKDGVELIGWDDLMERGVFFDELESEYVIWSDDPTDEGRQDLQLPPNGERVEVRRGADGMGEARFRFNQAEILVKGRVVKRNEVLLKQVVELPRTANVKALPINGEEAVCIDWNAGGVEEDETRKGFWNVRLRGGWRPFSWQAETFQEPVLSEPDNVTLLVWPGFEDPEWKAETVVYGITKTKGKPPKVRCYGAGPRKSRNLGEHRGLDIARSMLHLPRRVEALEFRSARNEPLGYIWPKRRPLYPGQIAEAIVALDFGTSNTAICWKGLQPKPQAVPMDQDAPPLELLAPARPEQREEIAKTLCLLPFWPKLSAPYWCIPSELLFFKESEQWTIPHDSVDPAQLENMDIRRDFKWVDEEKIHRLTYLRMVLRMAFASLRAQGIRSVKLRATYPLAFESGHLSGYDEVLQDLRTQLATETGMQIGVTGYVNESISGLQASGQQAGNLQCVIDFGGGTTDIAIRIVEPGRDFGEPFIVDSVRLAGNDVIDSLLADPVLLEGILKHGKASLSNGSQADNRKKVARQIVLGELRSSGQGMPPWWRDLTADQQGERRDAAQLFAMRNRALFDGVLAYVLKLMAAAEQEMRRNGSLPEGQGAQADVFLLGQGWGLLRLQSGRSEHDPLAYVQKRLEELRASLPFAPPKGEFDVYGPGYEVRNALKLATSFGAALLPSVRSAAELEGKMGRQTIFGVDVSFSDGAAIAADELLDDESKRPTIKGAVKKNGAWDQFVSPLLAAPGMTDHVRQLFGSSELERRKYVESRLSYLVSTHIREQLAKSVAPRLSPLILLLEHIWVEQLKRLDGKPSGSGAV